MLSKAYPLAAGLTQAQAKQRAKTLLKELHDNMEAGKSKRDSTSPLDFPPDMPNLFHLQHLRLQNVEPVYNDGQVHPAKPKLVEYWKATFYHRMPVGKGADGKTIYATTAGQYLSFTFKKIIHSLDAQLLPIYTAATRALQLPHGAVFDATTAVVYRLFGNVFLPVLRTTEGEVPMCEGAVRGEGVMENEKRENQQTSILISGNGRIIPYIDMSNYSHIWSTIVALVKEIPICALIWDVYNDPNINPGRDIYINIQPYPETERAAGVTYNNIQSKDEEGPFKSSITSLFRTITDGKLKFDMDRILKYDRQLLKVTSFEGLNVVDSGSNYISLITLKAYPYYENDFFYANRRLVKQLLLELIHEIGAHIVGDSETEDEHTKFGWIESEYENIPDSCSELLFKQIGASTRSKNYTGFIRATSEVMKINGEVFHDANNNLVREDLLTIDTKEIHSKDWLEGFEKLEKILTDPLIDNPLKILNYLKEKYNEKIR